MIRILGIVAYKILPANMGGQKGIHLFYTALANITKTQVVGTLSNKKIFTTYNFILIFQNNSLKYINLFLSFKLLKIIKDKNPDVVILEHPYLLIHQLIIKYFTKKKIIIHSHNIEYLRFKNLGKKWWWLLKIWEGISYKKANKVFFISEEDQEFAIKQWHLKIENTLVIPYGINRKIPLLLSEKNNGKKQICNTLNLTTDTTLFFFNGTLDYLPNKKALQDIQEKIFPLLLEKNPLGRYALIVTGSKTNKDIQEIVKNSPIPIFLLGFVEDISLYYTGCDIFLNLVNTGGGIKTKLVEAIGYGMNAVSYIEGAWGIDNSCTINKLFCSNHIEDLTNAIIQFEQQPYVSSSPKYYQKYAWDNIALQVKKEIEILTSK
ncbi:MAG: glycosyltransferase [Chitinophagaceae bacterium]